MCLAEGKAVNTISKVVTFTELMFVISSFSLAASSPSIHPSNCSSFKPLTIRLSTHLCTCSPIHHPSTPPPTHPSSQVGKLPPRSAPMHMSWSPSKTDSDKSCLAQPEPRPTPRLASVSPRCPSPCTPDQSSVCWQAGLPPRGAQGSEGAWNLWPPRGCENHSTPWPKCLQGDGGGGRGLLTAAGAAVSHVCSQPSLTHPDPRLTVPLPKPSMF